MCGIIGVVAKSPVNQLLYDGLLVLQHRGQDAAGIARSLQDQGFQVVLHEGGPRGGKDGLVTDQEPAPGHRVATRDSIVLFYHP